MQFPNDQPQEYGKLFQFFFAYRAIALAFAFIWLLFKIYSGQNNYAGLGIWLLILVYTLVIYVKRQALYRLVLNKPMILAADVLISALLMNVYSASSTPFFYYSVSPIIPAAVLFRFKGATLSSTVLTISHFVSVLTHEGSIMSFFAVDSFPLLSGQIFAYFTVGFLCIFPADMLREIAQQRVIIKEHKQREAFAKLTEREQEVLRLLAVGLDNEEIANMIYVSRSTVKNHVSNILTKLELRNRTQAAAYAALEGLIEQYSSD